MTVGSSGGLQGDVVSEAFELGDEAAGCVFGVAAVEVGGAGGAGGVSSHLEPCRVLPERRLPAERSLPGHWPAQLARWRSEGKRLMSVPISAITDSAVRRWTAGGAG